MPVRVVRPDAAERAQEAIRLMGTGVPIAEACKRAKTTHGTVKKVLKELKVKTKVKKTRHGRKKVIVDAHKIDKAQCVVRKIQYEGMSASEACKACHTTVKTVRAVRLDNCRTLRKYHGKYRLQVYEVKKFAVVFFGRLRNKGSSIDITHTAPFEEPDRIEKASLRRDDYATIMWQYDFDVFQTTLSAEDLCEYYMPKVLDFLKAELVDVQVTKLSGKTSYIVSPLEEMFRPGAELSDEEKCGVDDRRVTSDFVCLATLKKGPVTDTGAFQVLVIRKSGRSAYPITPRQIPYPRSLVSERAWKLLRFRGVVS